MMKLKTGIFCSLLLAALLAPVSVLAGCPPPGGPATATEEVIENGVHVCKPPSGSGSIDTVGKLIDRMAAVLNTIVPFIIGLAVFVILWGIFGYISHAGEEEKRTEARQFIVWGIIGIFFMLSIWGFVNVLDKSFNLKKEPPAEFPHLPAIPGS